MDEAGPLIDEVAKRTLKKKRREFSVSELKFFRRPLRIRYMEFINLLCDFDQRTCFLANSKEVWENSLSEIPQLLAVSRLLAHFFCHSSFKFDFLYFTAVIDSSPEFEMLFPSLGWVRWRCSALGSPSKRTRASRYLSSQVNLTIRREIRGGIILTWMTC